MRSQDSAPAVDTESVRTPEARPRRRSAAPAQLDDNPLWYRDAIIYEVHVRAFRDSTADGTGDFRGLIEKLEYLRDLGVTAIWLLPFYPSPLRDDGYDIADYTSVNPAYGTLADFRALVRAAHAMGLRIITELVCNHTSDQHPWFQRARRAPPGSPWRDFYVWSDTTDRFLDARIIFKDTETSNWTWDPVARAYFWHRFYSHQPDLNFANPRVKAALFRAVDFWLEQGVDGLRLDAVPYLYEQDGTDCENLPETHAFLRELRSHVDARFRNRMLLSEANQWPEDAVRYFGSGDETHMAFHFPLMPRMFMAIRMEDRLPIVDILEQTPAIPEGCQWALFLRNHDELTLEMVTDEERDYMYRVYANDPQARINLGIRRRLAPLLGNHRRRIELMAGLLFSLPGTPVLYYGDEIGMGDNVYLGDRNGVRTPMQWSADGNAGFSEAGRHQLFLPVIVEPEYHYEAVNVAIQQANPHSLLWWVKRLIALRKRHSAFGRGSIEFLQPDNHRILAFIRHNEDETILVVANLSRFFQPVELDLSAHEGSRLVELFGRVEFPTVGRAPYPLSLGPHEFMWFNLEAQAPAPTQSRPVELAILPDYSMATLTRVTGASPLTQALFTWIAGRSWYRGRNRRISGAEIRDRIPIRFGRRSVVVIVFSIDYMDGDTDSYFLPLAKASTDSRGHLVLSDGTRLPDAADAQAMRIARLRAPGTTNDSGMLVDGTFDPGLESALLATITGRRRIRGARGQLVGQPSRSAGARGPMDDAGPRVVQPDGAAGAIIEGQRIVLQLYAALEPGVRPEREMGIFLTDRGYPWIRPVIGAVEYRLPDGLTADLALAQEAAPRDGDLLSLARDALLGYFEQAAAGSATPDGVTLTARAIFDAAGHDVPPDLRASIGVYLDTAHSLGARIAEMHRILATSPTEPAFTPEPFTELHQRSLYHSADAAAARAFRVLARRLNDLDVIAAADARLALELRGEADNHLRRLLLGKLGGSQIRTHGALDLGKVLHSGVDLRIIDLDGDPERSASERRLRRTPLYDVAAILGSLHDVALGRSRGDYLGGSVRHEDVERLQAWARAWYLWVSATFLRGYRDGVAGASFMPPSDEGWVTILDALLLSQAFGELRDALTTYQGDRRSPIRGVLELLGY